MRNRLSPWQQPLENVEAQLSAVGEAWLVPKGLASNKPWAKELNRTTKFEILNQLESGVVFHDSQVFTDDNDNDKHRYFLRIMELWISRF